MNGGQLFARAAIHTLKVTICNSASGSAAFEESQLGVLSFFLAFFLSLFLSGGLGVSPRPAQSADPHLLRRLN